MRRRGPLAAAVLLAAGSASGCSTDHDRELTVLAAASLTEVFTDLGEEFERQHDDVEVAFSFGSSTTLAQQAADGAPGDVLASADAASIDIARDAGVLPEGASDFAANELVLVVAADGPAISGLDDLAGTDWVRCADDVPCGRLARDLLASHHIAAEPVSLEVDVKAVLTKVTSGEAEAGMVYRTDARVAGDDVRTVEIPGADDELTIYTHAVLEQSAEPELAGDWLTLVESAAGRDALEAAGFRTLRLRR